ncbi:MAG: acetoin utilization protein AcuC [Pseudonocardiales bacterium]|nr:acetoin utilization protein AcuC [Pseudonocardiales bacterium]MBV9447333.1 acetoin utilization protein AcuC [Streptosporangiaceae bacterium]MBV9729986.1 acetoin utilization protein AcuC [Pseudonocardiales bacterium]
MNPPRAVVVWDEALLGYDLGGRHPLNPIRLDLTIRLARSLGVLDGVQPLTPVQATDDELRTVHSNGYLAAVKQAPRGYGYVGHGLGTPDNPIFYRMHEASALVAGGSLLAADAILTGRAARAANIAGGLHHAMRDHASGFCIYNDCALAIRRLLDGGMSRVAYVDIDVHHGDGVQEAFADDPRVLTISLHQHPATLFPGTGRSADVGAHGAEGSAVNVPLPPGTSDGEWLRAFHAVVPALLRMFQPEVLVTQHGADTHVEDPLANLMLSVDGQRAAHRALGNLADATAGGRWLALGGGGYSLFRVVPRSWTHLLATVLDREVDPNTAVPAEWMAYAATVARGAPLPISMTDGVEPLWTPWDGTDDTPLDRAIRETRRAVYPLHDLDPEDPWL